MSDRKGKFIGGYFDKADAEWLQHAAKKEFLTVSQVLRRIVRNMRAEEFERDAEKVRRQIKEYESNNKANA